MKTLDDILPQVAGQKCANNLILGMSILNNTYLYSSFNKSCKNLSPQSFIMEDAPFVVDEIKIDKTQKLDYRYYSDHYIKTGRWSEEQDTVFTVTTILYYLFAGHLPWHIDDNIKNESRTKQRHAVFNARQNEKLNYTNQLPSFIQPVIECGITNLHSKTKLNDLLILYCSYLQDEIRSSGMAEWMPELDDRFKLDDVCKTILESLTDCCQDEEDNKNQNSGNRQTYNNGNPAMNISSNQYNTNENQANTNTDFSFEEQKSLYSRCGVLETFQFKHGDGTNGLNKVAGMENLKESMRNEVLFPLLHPEISQRYKLHMTNGMLLYGPPGCGKTFFAEHFANEGAMSYCLIKASEISSSYIHGTQLLVQQLFDQAKRNSPCVLCFDEIDAMCPTRRDYDIKVAAETNTFLSELNNLADSGIFVIGTTNRPDIIDSAVLRTGRFDKKVYVPAPDAKAREAIFDIELRDRPLTSDVNCQELGQKAENFTASDISAVVNYAAMEAARKEELISQAVLLRHIANTSPSLSEEIRHEYELLHNKMETRNSHKHNRIGFY